MAKLAWSLKDEDTLIAKGDDTGVEFTIVVIREDGDDGNLYSLSFAAEPHHSAGYSLVELMLEAQAIENRTEIPLATQ